MEFTEQVMRPPQEAKSLLPRATQGCTYNKCNFCYVSRGYPFQAVTPEQLEKQLLSLKSVYPSDTRIYLTGSNPFALPAAKLSAYIEVLRRHFPAFSVLSMQAHIPDIASKSPLELAELREKGLSMLYIGTENGSDEALALMNKGHTAAQTVEQLLRLDEAGIEYTNFYILGMAGRGKGVQSGIATAEMFNQAHPVRITTTGLTVFPNSPLHEMTLYRKFVEASEREKVGELLAFLEHLTTDTFFDSVHYLNPLCYRFNTATEKDGVLADIRDFLASHSDEDIELMVSRKQMRSL